ncbi:type II toxin-antitoxin system HipA family toxin [Noviherbaspirillum suwonense]|jgi:serine/threonine-protein kinase HipA|uniref:Serine/threonine-protein kinase HipA n=1 Tax=Noviherbaspirillum suwonense TaxID=1224511 RepID=A0ABY1PX44_9BURK|nr:HipA domain-containing protein [Noviherbaspirillum suwonense]SMP51740.1 serine/threonine-protein kinase HipA [Noviherbaspirillum suwonense]
MPITSRSLYVYLQRPDDGEWVTVGRYLAAAHGEGYFRYAPSYVDAGLAWSIDPVNLRFVPGLDVAATRYRGLHDVLRDACPDAWGQALLRREHNLPGNAPPLQYLQAASNIDRWGALAVGASAKAPKSNLGSPAPPRLDQVVEELAALSERRPAIRAKIRSRLIQTASVGGARPKSTVQDDTLQFWLVKPGIASDVANIPLLEHVGQQWGRASGLDFAATVFHPAVGGRSAVRVLRFDRHLGRRLMCVSAASLLQAEYPDDLTQTDRWSYPRLAEELRLAGSPPEDRVELFGRMVFNAACGNDDDHVRNHAIVYRADEGRWRLAPAFDVVPNPVETPRRLHMQLSVGRFDISRDAVLADAHRFGFSGKAEAASYLDILLDRIGAGFAGTAHWLDNAWRQTLHERLTHNAAVLKGLPGVLSQE